MTPRGSFSRRLGWPLLLGGIAAACGSSSDLGGTGTLAAGGLTQANTGGAGARTGGRATGGTSTSGGTKATGGYPYTGGTCSTGYERCPCYGNNTCNPGLTCASGLCVNLASTGGANTGGAATGGVLAVTGGTASGGKATGGVATGGVSTGGSAPAGGTGAFGGAANRFALIAPACTMQCAAQSGLACSWDTMGFSCVTDICEDPVAPSSLYATAAGCEDLYVGMMLCWGYLVASQWECSDQDVGIAWPAPVAGTACEAATCAWNCCEYNGVGLLYDINFVGPRCNECQ